MTVCMCLCIKNTASFLCKIISYYFLCVKHSKFLAEANLCNIYFAFDMEIPPYKLCF
jgi:hypothetical protein